MEPRVLLDDEVALLSELGKAEGGGGGAQSEGSAERGEQKCGEAETHGGGLQKSPDVGVGAGGLAKSSVRAGR